MPNHQENSTIRHRSALAPGTGRLGLVSAYFQLSGFAGALGTAAIAVSLLLPPMQTSPLNALVALGGATLMTFGFFHTSRLLDQRRKAGAKLAAVCFAGPLVAYLTGAIPSLSTLTIAGVGLALVVSVWRHLD